LKKNEANDSFSKSFKNFFIKLLVDYSTLRDELFMDDSLVIEEANEHAFDF